MTDPLLAGWPDLLARLPSPAVKTSPLRPRLQRLYYAQQITLVRTADDAARMVQVAYEFPISVIGLDTEYRFGSEHAVQIAKGREWRDLRSIFPFCISLAIVSENEQLRFVVDLRDHTVLPFVQTVLDLPVPFAVHHAKGDLAVLWSLGLREPRQFWDTRLAERVLRLGRSVTRAAHTPSAEYEDEESRRAWEQQEANRLTLHATAIRYSVHVEGDQSKVALQKSFLTKPFDEELGASEIEYAALDAVLTAGIYHHQQEACNRAGVLWALNRVVMDWNITAADMEWEGVLLCPERCKALLSSCASARGKIAANLSTYGITNPNSRQQIGSVLTTAGLASCFPKTKTGDISTIEEVLKEREHLHPMISLVLRWKKVGQWSNDPAINGRITGTDGRVHADFQVLGAESGRTQSRRPNLMGIGRVFRPLVVARPGHGIGDADLSQIEIAVAAAVLHDDALVQDFNRGDVYAAMAKKIYREQFSADDLALSDADFKKKHKTLRNNMKPLVLGIIYGKSVDSIARDLGIPAHQAQRLWDAFTGCYPALRLGMQDAGEQALRRGYAYLSGLRRFRVEGGKGTAAERRSLANATIQGTAALVFYEAGNRLRALYRQHDARLILSVHDAFVFESPLGALSQVADLTRTVMAMTVQQWFPSLRPRVEINIKHPECWNYDGEHDSLERFAADPLLKL